MSIVQPSSLLRKALVADAVVSGGVAVLQVTGSTYLSELLSLPQALIFESGVFLVLYTVLLIALSRSTRVAAALISAVVVGNIGWALACALLVLGNMVTPNALGLAFLTVQVVSVLAFAALEWAGLRASPVAAGATSSAHRVS